MESTVPVIGRPKGRKTIRPGISKDAEQLGVSRQHLVAVLDGIRKSDQLLKRYLDLKASQTKARNSSHSKTK